MPQLCDRTESRESVSINPGSSQSGPGRGEVGSFKSEAIVVSLNTNFHHRHGTVQPLMEGAQAFGITTGV